MSGSAEEVGTNPLEYVPVDEEERSTSVPSSPKADASEEEKELYHRELTTLIEDWCKSQSEAPHSCVRAVWSDPICDFSRSGSWIFSIMQSTACKTPLIDKGVYLRKQMWIFEEASLTRVLVCR